MMKFSYGLAIFFALTGCVTAKLGQSNAAIARRLGGHEDHGDDGDHDHDDHGDDGDHVVADTTTMGHHIPCKDPANFRPDDTLQSNCEGEEYLDKDSCEASGCHFPDHEDAECECHDYDSCVKVDASWDPVYSCTTPMTDGWTFLTQAGSCDEHTDHGSVRELMHWWGGECCNNEAALCEDDGD